MTTQTLPTRPAAPPATRRHHRGQWLRRWYKLTIPLVIVFLLIVWTIVAHMLQGVDVTDTSYLNPASTAPLGGSDLAGLLRAGGITVRRVTSTADAFGSINGPTTVFIPAPSLVEPIDLGVIRALPTGTRVVLVAPDEHTVIAADLPFDVAGTHWATQVDTPGCDLPAAHRAGAAAPDRIEYIAAATDAATCYDGSLIEMHDGGADLIVVGASDPFRNDRIHEHGNATLATGLLNTRPNLVWLDLHRAESITPTPIATVTGGHLPSGGGDDSSSRSSIAGLFPGWLWTAIGTTLLIGVALALAAGRRLGPPVSEPMAVAPRANETIEGRARLYRRTGDRKAAFAMLRGAVIARLAAATDLTPDAPDADVVTAMATRTGRPADEIDEILFGADVGDGQKLVRAVARLDDLTRAAGL